MILLKADEGLSDPQIMAGLSISRPMVEHICKPYVLGGLGKALEEDPRPGQKCKFDGRGEAQLIAITCWARPLDHAAFGRQVG